MVFLSLIGLVDELLELVLDSREFRCDPLEFDPEIRNRFVLLDIAV